jgi:plastocyanin
MQDHESSHRVLANRLRSGVIFALVLACVAMVGVLLRMGQIVIEDAPPRVNPIGTIPKAQHSTRQVKADEAAKEKALALAMRGAPPPASRAAAQEVAEALSPEPDEVALPRAGTSRDLEQAAAVASLGAGTGAIVGKVILTGTPPPEATLTMDPSCGSARGTNVIASRHFVVGPDGGLADVFVYIDSGSRFQFRGPKRTPVLIDQRGCEYVPYVVGAQVGQTILVRNSDPVLHNVHWTPTAPRSIEVNVAQLPKDKDLAFTFNEPEVLLRLKCDIHPWMFAYVGLVPHPYFAVTDTNGVFTIPDVPAGAHRVRVLHRKSHPTTPGLPIENVAVEPGQAAQLMVEIPAPEPATAQR